MQEPIRIHIPDRDVRQEAGQIVVDALREAGLNPSNRRVQSHPMVRSLLAAWGRGESTREQFVNGCRNLLVLDPRLSEV